MTGMLMDLFRRRFGLVLLLSAFATGGAFAQDNQGFFEDEQAGIYEGTYDEEVGEDDWFFDSYDEVGEDQTWAESTWYEENEYYTGFYDDEVAENDWFFDSYDDAGDEGFWDV